MDLRIKYHDYICPQCARILPAISSANKLVRKIWASVISMKVCWNSSESMRRASSTLWDSNPLKLRQPPKMVSRTQLSTSKSWTRSLSQSVHPQEWQDPMRCLKEKFSVRCRNGRADADGCWGWEIRCILVLDRCSVPLNPGKDSKFDLIKLISSHANDWGRSEWSIEWQGPFRQPRDYLYSRNATLSLI